MVDYRHPSTSVATLIIRDEDGYVSFWIEVDDSPATNTGDAGWSGRVNGTNVSGRYSWPAASGKVVRQIAGRWTVTKTQDVTFAIAATGTQGLGGPTSFTQRITRAVPGTPSGLSPVWQSDKQIYMTWVRNGTYTGFIVQRRTDGGAWQTIATVAGSANSYTDKSTGANRRYEYRVAATNAAGQSGWSNVGTVYTTPAVPTGVTAVRQGSGILVDASGKPPYATAFDVRDGDSVVASDVTLPWVHTSPDPAVPHTYRVRAKRGTLVSGWSDASNTVQLIARPNAPASLSPNGVAQLGVPWVRFSWQHNPVDSAEQTAFELRYRPVGGSWVTVSGGSGNSYASAFVPDVYEWQVRTKGAHPDWSPWSVVATVDVIDRPGVAVTQPVGVWSSSVLSVEWTYFQAQSRPQSSWQVELLDSALVVVESRSGQGSGSAVSFGRRLVPGSWTVRARAASGDVWSEWAEVPFTVVFDPPAPPSLDAVWDESQGGVPITVGSGDPDVSVPGVTNLLTNPRFVASGARVEVYRNRIKNPQSTLAARNAVWGTGGAGTVGTVGSGADLTFTQTWTTAPTGGDAKTDIIWGSGAYVVPVTPGETLSFQVDAARALGGQARLTLAWDTSSGTFIQLVRSADTVVSTDWRNPTMLTVGGVAPANAGRVRLSVDMVGAVQSGDTLYSRKPRMNGRPYSDGGFSPIEGVQAAWAGPVNESESTLHGFAPRNVSGGNGRFLVSGNELVRIISTGNTNDVAAGASLPIEGFTVGQVYTVLATLHVPEGLAAEGSYASDRYPRAIYMLGDRATSVRAPDGPGTYDLRLVFTAKPSHDPSVRLGGGGGAWGDAVVWSNPTVVEGEYTGPAFNGSTGTVFIDGIPRRTIWDGPEDASTSSTTDFPPTVQVIVERSITGGDTWEPVAEITEATTLIDWESLSYGVTLYRATAATIEGATTSTTVEVNARSDAIWLSCGSNYEMTARLPHDPVPQISGGRERVSREWAGRKYPVSYHGEMLAHAVTMTGKITDRDIGAPGTETADIHRLMEIVQAETDQFLLRIPAYGRVYGGISSVSMPRLLSTHHPEGFNGWWRYSFTITEAVRP
ncbi:hypothetical protein [Microbacterium sp. YY-01]|uniref:hypothetical protein n=1 Tax=Microbacterium sp. YY-01 TaxID=3421634 RepID=UPI003D184781